MRTHRGGRRLGDTERTPLHNPRWTPNRDSRGALNSERRHLRLFVSRIVQLLYRLSSRPRQRNSDWGFELAKKLDTSRRAAIAR